MNPLTFIYLTLINFRRTLRRTNGFALRAEAGAAGRVKEIIAE
jgi:hypothetical protein